MDALKSFILKDQTEEFVSKVEERMLFGISGVERSRLEYILKDYLSTFDRIDQLEAENNKMREFMEEIVFDSYVVGCDHVKICPIQHILSFLAEVEG